MNQELFDYIDRKLYEKKAVASKHGYFDHGHTRQTVKTEDGEQRHRLVRVAAQLSLPDPSQIYRFVQVFQGYLERLCSHIERRCGKILDMETGRQLDVEESYEVADEDPVQVTLEWLLESKSRKFPFNGSLYFNWVNDEDMRKTVSFERLRKLIFPGALDNSVAPGELEELAQPPYGFRLPLRVDLMKYPNYQPEYDTVKIGDTAVSSFPMREIYTELFYDAANAHLAYAAEFSGAEIAWWLLKKLRRSTAKAMDTEQFMIKSETDLPTLF